MKAQGIEAGTATTAGRGPKDESPVGEADAPALGANGVSQSAVERARKLAAEIMVAVRQEAIDRCSSCEHQDEFEALTLVPMLQAALATQPASDTGPREALNRAQADLAYIERMPTHGMNDQSYINAMRRNIGEAMQRIRAALASTSDEGGERL